jgi:hypothetical protein
MYPTRDASIRGFISMLVDYFFSYWDSMDFHDHSTQEILFISLIILITIMFIILTILKKLCKRIFTTDRRQDNFPFYPLYSPIHIPTPTVSPPTSRHSIHLQPYESLRNDSEHYYHY